VLYTLSLHDALPIWVTGSICRYAISEWPRRRFRTTSGCSTAFASASRAPRRSEHETLLATPLPVLRRIRKINLEYHEVPAHLGRSEEHTSELQSRSD